MQHLHLVHEDLKQEVVVMENKLKDLTTFQENQQKKMQMFLNYFVNIRSVLR